MSVYATLKTWLFLLHFLRPNDLFVDVGANAGSYSILAGAVSRSSGYAFEPVPISFERLVENVRLNHLERKIKCINKGVGSTPGMLTFTTDRDTMNRVILSEKARPNTMSVEVTTLDEELDDDFPSAIKIDVEGYEVPVLKGARKSLARETLNAVIIEMNGSGLHYGFDDEDVLRLMSHYDFKMYCYNPFTRSLVETQGKESPNSNNALFIRDVKYVLDRVKNGPRVAIFDQLI